MKNRASLVIGRRYRRKDGKKVRIVGTITESDYPVSYSVGARFVGDDGQTYSPNGRNIFFFPTLPIFTLHP